MSSGRRNAGRRGIVRIGDVAPSAQAQAARRDPDRPRRAWVSWLEPRFADNGSLYITGTYCDEYGFANGLMLARNVHKDFIRFLDKCGCDDRRFICGVEQHKYRDILHLHGIIEGPFDDLERAWLGATWQSERGFVRLLPVLDGCASYVTKYALKTDTDNFEWRL